jgi:hypothetical protein
MVRHPTEASTDSEATQGEGAAEYAVHGEMHDPDQRYRPADRYSGQRLG